MNTSPEAADGAGIGISQPSDCPETYGEAADIIESIADGFFAADRDWRVTHVNRHAEALWNKRREDVLGRNIWDVFPQAIGTPMRDAMQRAMSERQALSCEAASPVTGRWFRCSFYPSRAGLSVYMRDISAEKYAEENLLAQRQILGMVARGAPLAETLDELLCLMEAREPGARCGLPIVAEDGLHFRSGNGPSLPEAYHRALAGAPITPPYPGSCAEAAQQCTAVIVPDIAAERRYSDAWRSLMLSCGFKAVRSTPVRGSDGRVLASLAIYYGEPRDPTPANPDLIGTAIDLAAIALERSQALDAMRVSEARFRALVETSSDVIYRMSADWGEMRQLHGREFIADTAEPSRTWLDRYIFPEDQPEVMRVVGEAARARSVFQLEHRVRRNDGSVGWTSSRAVPVLDEHGAVREWFGAASDITESKRAQALTECQRAALQRLAEGAPLEDALGFLLRAAEQHAANGMLGSILLLDETGTHFASGIGPSLPAAFNAAVAGVPVASGLGVCCHAVSGRRPVVVRDFAADPGWARFLEFVGPYGLRAGWSTPIFGSNGNVLGTFANYYREPCDPTPRELEWVEIVTRTAAIAIERAGTDAALRQYRENLTAAMAASDTGTFRWDPRTGAYLHFDQNLKRLFGFAPDEPVRVTEDFIRRVHPDDLPALLPAIEACRNGADFSMEYRIVLPGGGIRWLYDRARMERDRDGNPTCLVGACTDVTKRREAEERLRESEEQFRTLADSIPQLAWMARPDGSIFWYNRGWYAYTGTTPEAMMGWGWQAVHDPDMLATVMRRWRASIANATPFEMVFPLKAADGTFHSFLTRAVPVRGADGHVAMWFGSNTDISGQLETEETLRRLTETLERELEERTRALQAETAERQKVEAALHQVQRLEAIGQLTGGVAHDFNNLLTVIIGNCESILLLQQVPERAAARLGAIQRAAERGAQLTGQLLAFARRQHLRPETTALERSVPAFSELLRRAVGESIAVTIDAADGLWPVRIDPAQFEAAILNLAINARDAMPSGGCIGIAMRNETLAGLDAKLHDLAPGDYVAVAVRDSGSGMNAEVLRHCFEPFFTTKEVGRGTGLGLSQVYGFARQSGGTATAESELGRGTTISLYLPRARSDADELRAAIDPKLAAGHGETILLVEDQPDLRAFIASQLTEIGYRVIPAADGVEAGSVLKRDEAIRLLLTDIIMPNGVSGIELARRARRLRQDMKVLLMSGYPRDELGGTEGWGFLQKPFRPAQLAAAVAAALSGDRRE